MLFLPIVAAVVTQTDIENWQASWGGNYTLTAKQNCNITTANPSCAHRCLDVSLNVVGAASVLIDFNHVITSVRPKLDFIPVAKKGLNIDSCKCGSGAVPTVSFITHALQASYNTSDSRELTQLLDLTDGSPSVLRIAFNTTKTGGINGQACTFVYTKDVPSSAPSSSSAASASTSISYSFATSTSCAAPAATGASVIPTINTVLKPFSSDYLSNSPSTPALDDKSPYGQGPILSGADSLGFTALAFASALLLL
jgi:hypothetical protein